MNREHGQDMSGAPDPLTPLQRSIAFKRREAAALASKWELIAAAYQSALAAEKAGDMRNYALYMQDAARLTEEAGRMPTP